MPPTRLDTGTRDCRACGHPFERRRAESIAEFEQRDLCSDHCRRTAQSTPQVRAAAGQARHCRKPGCGKLLTRHPGERLYRFAGRQYCDRACSTTRTLTDTAPPRICERDACDTTLTRRPGESQTHFRARLYCCRDCRIRADREAATGRADARRAARADAARARRAARPKPVLTVFGDAPPAEPWRPAAWR